MTRRVRCHTGSEGTRHHFCCVSTGTESPWETTFAPQSLVANVCGAVVKLQFFGFTYFLFTAFRVTFSHVTSGEFCGSCGRLNTQRFRSTSAATLGGLSDSKDIAEFISIVERCRIAAALGRATKPSRDRARRCLDSKEQYARQRETEAAGKTLHPGVHRSLADGRLVSHNKRVVWPHGGVRCHATVRPPLSQ